MGSDHPTATGGNECLPHKTIPQKEQALMRE